jgi:hypothetical protein
MPYGADLALLASETPRLDGAACKGRPEIFDAQPPKNPDRDYLHARANTSANANAQRSKPAEHGWPVWMSRSDPRGWSPVKSLSRGAGATPPVYLSDNLGGPGNTPELPHNALNPSSEGPLYRTTP